MAKRLSSGSESTNSESSNQNGDILEKNFFLFVSKGAEVTCKEHTDNTATLKEIMEGVHEKFSSDSVENILRKSKYFKVYKRIQGDKLVTLVEYKGGKPTWEEMKEMYNKVKEREKGMTESLNQIRKKIETIQKTQKEIWKNVHKRLKRLEKEVKKNGKEENF